MVRFIDKFASTSELILGHYYTVGKSDDKFYWLNDVKYKYPKKYFEWIG